MGEFPLADTLALLAEKAKLPVKKYVNIYDIMLTLIRDELKTIDCLLLNQTGEPWDHEKDTGSPIRTLELDQRHIIFHLKNYVLCSTETQSQVGRLFRILDGNLASAIYTHCKSKEIGVSRTRINTFIKTLRDHLDEIRKSPTDLYLGPEEGAAYA